MGANLTKLCRCFGDRSQSKADTVDDCVSHNGKDRTRRINGQSKPGWCSNYKKGTILDACEYGNKVAPLNTQESKGILRKKQFTGELQFDKSRDITIENTSEEIEQLIDMEDDVELENLYILQLNESIKSSVLTIQDTNNNRSSENLVSSKETVKQSFTEHVSIPGQVEINEDITENDGRKEIAFENANSEMTAENNALRDDTVRPEANWLTKVEEDVKHENGPADKGIVFSGNDCSHSMDGQTSLSREVTGLDSKNTIEVGKHVELGNGKKLDKCTAWFIPATERRKCKKLTPKVEECKAENQGLPSIDESQERMKTKLVTVHGKEISHDQVASSRANIKQGIAEDRNIEIVRFFVDSNSREENGHQNGHIEMNEISYSKDATEMSETNRIKVFEDNMSNKNRPIGYDIVDSGDTNGHSKVDQTKKLNEIGMHSKNANEIKTHVKSTNEKKIGKAIAWFIPATRGNRSKMLTMDKANNSAALKKVPNGLHGETKANQFSFNGRFPHSLKTVEDYWPQQGSLPKSHYQIEEEINLTGTSMEFAIAEATIKPEHKVDYSQFLFHENLDANSDDEESIVDWNSEFGSQTNTVDIIEEIETSRYYYGLITFKSKGEELHQEHDLPSWYDLFISKWNGSADASDGDNNEEGEVKHPIDFSNETMLEEPLSPDNFVYHTGNMCNRINKLNERVNRDISTLPPKTKRAAWFVSECITEIVSDFISDRCTLTL